MLSKLTCWIFVVCIVAIHGSSIGIHENENSSRDIINLHNDIGQITMLSRHSLDLDQRIKVCGRLLINVMNLLCSKPRSRETRETFGGQESSIVAAMEVIADRKHFLRLFKRGASDACCQESCTFGYLKSKCPRHLDNASN